MCGRDRGTRLGPLSQPVGVTLPVLHDDLKQESTRAWMLETEMHPDVPPTMSTHVALGLLGDKEPPSSSCVSP